MGLISSHIPAGFCRFATFGPRRAFQHLAWVGQHTSQILVTQLQPWVNQLQLDGGGGLDHVRPYKFCRRCTAQNFFNFRISWGGGGAKRPGPSSWTWIRHCTATAWSCNACCTLGLHDFCCKSAIWAKGISDWELCSLRWIQD